MPGTLTFQNSTAFNDYFQGFTWSASFSFIVVLSGPAIDAPDHTSVSGSTFAISLYDSAGVNPLLTNAISGAIFTVDINLDGTTTPTAYSPDGVNPSLASFSLLQIPADSYQVAYASNLPTGQSYVNITNAGTRSGFDPAGGICANVYVFDPSEEMVACCSCYVSPDGLRSLASQDLVVNSLTPSKPNGVVIKLLASLPSASAGTTCDATSPSTTNLEPGMRAWSTSLHLNTTTSGYQVTENPFRNAFLSLSELQKLTTFCGFIKANGSNFGICKECRVGGSLGGTIR